MHLLILADFLPPEFLGGAEKVAWAVAQGMAQRGYQVSALTTNPRQSYQSQVGNVLVYHVLSRYPERWRAWFSLANPQVLGAVGRLLDKLRPNLIHAHNIHSHLSYASLWLAAQRRIPVVLTAHDLMALGYQKIFPTDLQADGQLKRGVNWRAARLRYNPLRNIVIRALLHRHTQARSALSQHLAAVLHANGLPPYEVVYNGLALEEYAPPTSQAVSAFRAAHALTDKFVVAFGGRFTPEKGSFALLKAVDSLLGRVPSVTVLVLGGGEAQNIPWDAYQHLQPHHVRFTGWLSGAALQIAYASADVFAVPSLYLDPGAMMNLEGMWAGKPVIATCFGGAPELVLDGVTGYVLNPHDTEQFAARLEALWRDPALRQQMGAAGRQRVQTHFSLTRQLDAYEKLYRLAQLRLDGKHA
jgi:glycosyltransferase involved in cell wall biosynthesis